MDRIRLEDVQNLVEYEKVREEMRRGIITLKKDRRLSVGDNLTFLFENRETVLFQVQEMVRTERIVAEGKIQDEIDAYNALIPGRGELSATLFIEIPELIHMTNDEVRKTVNRFQGLDQGGVSLKLGSVAVPARFESGHSKEEKMAAVHYVRFAVPPSGVKALGDEAAEALIVVAHPRYEASARMPHAMRRELLRDLAG